MVLQEKDPSPEPVPHASQLAVMPFLAAVEGFLRGSIPKMDLRLTIHRVMSREREVYLQQVCDYLGPGRTEDRAGAGRMFPVNRGIIGAAFASGRVWRTRHYATEGELRAILAKDMEKTGDTRDPGAVRLSYLAVPFLGPGGQPVLVLFADTFDFDFFADNARITAVVDMCSGFCRLIDALEERPFPTLRNYAFAAGKPVTGSRTLYPTMQEEISKPRAPRVKNVKSFNYEAAAG
jgi:hypothetical protein